MDGVRRTGQHLVAVSSGHKPGSNIWFYGRIHIRIQQKKHYARGADISSVTPSVASAAYPGVELEGGYDLPISRRVSPAPPVPAQTGNHASGQVHTGGAGDKRRLGVRVCVDRKARPPPPPPPSFASSPAFFCSRPLFLPTSACRWPALPLSAVRRW